jgi:anti-sigma factor RsiW
MNYDMQDNNDVLFDRLVDGELSADERRLLIASLDDRADGWRRCALAFLEAQAWSREMERIVAEPNPYPAQPATSVNRQGTARSTTQTPSYTWLAIAAGLLMAFGLGWQLRQPAARQGMELAIDSPPPPQTVERGLSNGDAITLVVQNQHGQPQRVRVPLVEAAQLGQQFASAPQWAVPAVREQFEERGLDLQTRRRYAPLFFEQQGRVVPMIVPVDDAVITPVSRPFY